MLNTVTQLERVINSPRDYHTKEFVYAVETYPWYFKSQGFADEQLNILLAKNVKHFPWCQNFMNTAKKSTIEKYMSYTNNLTFCRYYKSYINDEYPRLLNILKNEVIGYYDEKTVKFFDAKTNSSCNKNEFIKSVMSLTSEEFTNFCTMRGLSHIIDVKHITDVKNDNKVHKIVNVDKESFDMIFSNFKEFYMTDRSNIKYKCGKSEIYTRYGNTVFIMDKNDIHNIIEIYKYNHPMAIKFV